MSSIVSSKSYLRLNGIQSSWGTQERILVCMTPRANAAKMLASGRRNADRFHGELFAIYVTQANLTPEDRMALERNVTLARAQEAHVEILTARIRSRRSSSTRGLKASRRFSSATISAARGAPVSAARRSIG